MADRDILKYVSNGDDSVSLLEMQNCVLRGAE